MVAITKRSVVGRNLTADEVDENFQNLNDAVTALQSARPQPDDFETVELDGSDLTFTTESGTVFGPFTLPVGGLHWRPAWLPFTAFGVLDTFVVAGSGIYTTLVGHTTGDVFEPDLLISGSPAYQQLFGTSASVADTIYDIELFFQGRLSDSGTDNPCEFLAPRQLLIPAAASHGARLKVASSTVAQVFPILHNGASIGHADFAIAATIGTVTITADELVPQWDLIEIGPPALADPAARGLMVVLAAQRVL